MGESLTAAVEREIAKLAERLPSAPETVEAALALALAAEIEGQEVLAARVTASKVLNETMDRLRAMAPAVEEEDELSKIRRRRDARRAS